MRPVLLMLVMHLGWSCSPSPGERLDGRQRTATLLSLGGQVDVLATGAVDWTRARAQAALYEEDQLRTFRGAWAQIAFAGGSTLRVEEESLISLGGGVTVERGTVQGELTAGLKVRTPSLEAESTPPRDIVFR
jgi:hypothetical protein